MNIIKPSLTFVLMLLILEMSYSQEWVSYQSLQQVNDLVDTGNELIMGTDAGLVVMNKSTLEKTIFNKSNSNLSNNHIQSIAMAPNGDTYIGTYDVIMGRFDGSDFQDIIIPEVDAFDQFTQLYDFEIAPNGDFWIATTDGVFHKQGQNWSQYDADELGDSFFEAWDIEINAAGEVFVASHHIHKFANGEWSNISEDTELFSYLDAELYFSNSGDLYFAGDLDRIGRFDGSQWYEYSNGGLNGSEVIGFTEDSNGTVYFNTQRDGLFRLENDSWVAYSDIQTNEFNNNTSLFYIDDLNRRWLNNNIYLSVNDNGVIQSTSISSTSLEYNGVYGIRKAQNGDMLYLMTTSTKSISRKDIQGNWSLLQMPSEVGLWPLIGDILFLSEDNIWLATSVGLYHYDNTEWSLINAEYCTDFARNEQGKIYVLANNKIFIIEDNEITSEYNTSNSELSDFNLSGIGVDANNNLWIASFTFEDEAKIQMVSANGEWTTFDRTEFSVIDEPNGDFLFDQDGNVWIPSGFVGALKYDGDTWTNPIAEVINELESYKVFGIENDSEGKLYFSHQYGVTTLFDGVWESLNIDDVPNTNSSFSSDIEFDDNGTLWWASNRYGVFSYTPTTITSSHSTLSANTALSIYPNPTQDYFILDFTLQDKANTQIYIYDNLGQMIHSNKAGLLPAGDFRQRIELTDIPTGIYTVQLKLNERIFTQRISVN